VLKAEGGDAVGSLGEQVSRATAILFVLLILLALGWLFGVVHNWGEIASRPVRLGFNLGTAERPTLGEPAICLRLGSPAIRHGPRGLLPALG
jgi:hypothetical protein